MASGLQGGVPVKLSIEKRKGQVARQDEGTCGRERSILPSHHLSCRRDRQNKKLKLNKKLKAKILLFFSVLNSEDPDSGQL